MNTTASVAMTMPTTVAIPTPNWPITGTDLPLLTTLTRSRCNMDRLADALVGPAPADVGDGSVDVCVSWAGLLSQQSCRRHDHAALAVAALRHLLRDPGLLHGMRSIMRQPFDRRDFSIFRLAQRERTGTNRAPIHMNRAGSAGSYAATVFGACQPELLPQHPQQRRVGIGFNRRGAPVDVELDHRRLTRMKDRHARSEARGPVVRLLHKSHCRPRPAPEPGRVLPCRPVCLRLGRSARRSTASATGAEAQTRRSSIAPAGRARTLFRSALPTGPRPRLLQYSMRRYRDRGLVHSPPPSSADGRSACGLEPIPPRRPQCSRRMPWPTPRRAWLLDEMSGPSRFSPQPD